MENLFEGHLIIYISNFEYFTIFYIAIWRLQLRFLITFSRCLQSTISKRVS